MSLWSVLESSIFMSPDISKASKTINIMIIKIPMTLGARIRALSCFVVVYDLNVW